MDEGQRAAAVQDGVVEGGADETPAPFPGDRLDPEGGRFRKADLLDAHLVLQPVDDFLHLGRAGLPLDAGVDILRILPEDHHVDFLGVLHRRGNAREVADRAEADVQVQGLAQGDVQAADAAADRGGQRALDADEVLAERIHRGLREPVAQGVERLLARQHFHPRDLAVLAVRLSNGGVKDAHGSAPDIRPGTVALDERHDRMIRNAELAGGDRDLVAGGNLGVLIGHEAFS